MCFLVLCSGLLYGYGIFKEKYMCVLKCITLIWGYVKLKAKTQQQQVTGCRTTLNEYLLARLNSAEVPEKCNSTCQSPLVLKPQCSHYLPLFVSFSKLTSFFSLHTYLLKVPFMTSCSILETLLHSLRVLPCNTFCSPE